MGGDHHRPAWRLHVSSLPFLFLSFCLLLLLSHANFILAQNDNKQASPSPAAFRPSDTYLIDCGSSSETKLDDGRTFKSDSEASSYLSTDEDVKASTDSIPGSAFSNSTPSSLQNLYKTARIFSSESTYTFFVSKPGKHWVRLYFYPLSHPQYDLKTAVFTVQTEKIVLLHDFSVGNDQAVLKEYVVNATERLSLVFMPKKGSYAFINAVEVVSIPDELLSDSAFSVPQGNTVNGLLNYAYAVSYRLNVGGPSLTPRDDTLSRTWEADDPYNKFPQGAQHVESSSIKFQPDKKITPLIAPELVYRTAEKMTNESYWVDMEPNFNLTWVMNVDAAFSYLIRLHFCDIVSLSLNDLYFNVYINGVLGVSGLDLSSKTGALATAYYTDFVVNATAITNGSIMVQVGPHPGGRSGLPNAILNGLEVLKLSNVADSLDGLFDVHGSFKGERSKVMKIIAISGLAVASLGMVFLGMVCIKWKKRPNDWQKRNSFSSWLLPIHGSEKSLSSKSGSRKSSIFGSRKSKSGYSGIYSNQGLGRFFTFNELQNATQNFDEKTVVGVGGFGKVFLGVLEDGTKVAIKRGNQGSEQGINEFQTEIQMLSKLRHRHLVSLIGFCDENSEMILVYEYMHNGPFRDHLYGSNQPTLSWKQRLEICIGAARGLHYLHTGAAQGIIHRDVKTTNILLDENFVAKVSDFGLSKAAPMEQGHVSTAVKGSFGYLDPEYFRRQQLTEKSDVYSFGVLLFEVLCARAVICPNLPREQVSLAEWAMQWHKKGMIRKIVDPKIAGTINEESLKKFAEAAEKCLAEYGVDRPSMGDVLWNLEYSLQLQEASTRIDGPDDTSKLMVLEDPSESGESTRASLAAAALVAANDDSDVTVGSQLHFPLGEIQGR